MDLFYFFAGGVIVILWALLIDLVSWIRARGDALTKLNQAAEANGEEL